MKKHIIIFLLITFFSKVDAMYYYESSGGSFRMLGSLGDYIVGDDLVQKEVKKISYSRLISKLEKI